MNSNHLNSEKTRKSNTKIILIAIGAVIITTIITLLIIVAINENVIINGDNETGG